MFDEGDLEDFGAFEGLPDESDSRAYINVTGEDFALLTTRAIDALVARNDPPRLFRRAGTLVRIERDETGIPVCKEATVAVMRHEMARAADWRRTLGKSEVPVEPRRSLVENVLATPEPPFPVLRGIASAPFFAADGSLVSIPGYSPSSRIILSLEGPLVIPEIDLDPDQETVRAAVDLIADLIGDFPFVEQADRAHAFGLLIIPFVRDMISGPTPLHFADAPTPGTGKTLLLQTLLGPACGQVPIRTLGRDDEETRKHLTSILVAGSTAVILDNISGKVQSSSLAAVLTSPTWSDRRLGTNSLFTVENTMIWTASANNASLSTEIARRSISIRIDAGLERPENRVAFRHSLPRYGNENRGRLIAAACTLVAAWIAARKPPSDATLGGYEAWSAVIGGILLRAGIPGFLHNRERLMEAADVEGCEWRAFVGAWFERYGTAEVPAAHLVSLAESVGMPLGTDDPKNAAMRLAKRLAAKRDRVYCDYRIELCKRKTTANAWRLLPAKPVQEVGTWGTSSTSFGAYNTCGDGALVGHG